MPYNTEFNTTPPLPSQSNDYREPVNFGDNEPQIIIPERHHTAVVIESMLAKGYFEVPGVMPSRDFMQREIFAPFRAAIDLMQGDYALAESFNGYCENWLQRNPQIGKNSDFLYLDRTGQTITEDGQPADSKHFLHLSEDLVEAIKIERHDIYHQMQPILDAGARLYRHALATLRPVVEALSKDPRYADKNIMPLLYPDIKPRQGLLRLLSYRGKSGDPILAAPHLDKSFITLTIAESHPGLQMMPTFDGNRAYYPLERDASNPYALTSGIYFPGMMGSTEFPKVQGHSELSPLKGTLHRVIQTAGNEERFSAILFVPLYGVANNNYKGTRDPELAYY